MASKSPWAFSKYSDAELGEILSDYHKDVFGFRLRMHGAPRAELVWALNEIDEYLTALQQTKEGRDELQANGWTFKEKLDG